MDKNLRSSEWVLVLSFLLLFVSIVAISQFNRQREFKNFPQHQKISVTISGAVSRPGTFLVLPGMTLEALLKKSRPKRFANLRDLDFKQRIEEPLKLHIEELKEIVVRIEGAAKPVVLQLEPGTRICDLKSKVECFPEADRKFFKRRRMLRDGETLEIPKHIERNSEISYSCGPILKTSFARRVFSFVCHPKWG